jgi:tetratricopeptide (TPR) repeat protein
MVKKKRANPELERKPVYLFTEKYHHVILIAILSLALILRILALLSLKGSIYFDFLLWDERLYHTWASNLARGTFESSSVYEMAPLPAYFMALIYRIFSPDIIYIRLTNIIFGVLTCWLVYLITRELSNRKIGLVACLVAALYNTAMSVFLFALACWLLVSVMGRNSMIRIFFLGVAIALAYNVRPNCLVLIPVIFVLIAWNVYRNKDPLKRIAMILILYTAGVVIVQSPFMIRNYMVVGEASATPSQAGLNLFICNNLQYGYPVPFASTVPSEMGIQFTIEASRRVGKKLSSSEASRYWTNEVIRTATERPVAFIWKQVKKLANFLNRFENSDHYDIGFLSDYVGFFKFPFLGFWLILPLGMSGMILNILKGRKEFALSVMFIIYALTLILFFTNIRVRLPLLVILIPFAVIGLDALWSFIKDRRSKKALIYYLVLAGFFIIEFIPVRDAKDMTAFLNTHAIILNSKGMIGEAVKYWEKSSSLEKHYSAFANLSLAGAYYSKGDKQMALSFLDRIDDKSFAASYKYDMIGDIMLREDKFDEAIEAYQKALEINSGLRTTRAKLVKALWRVDKQKALEENDRLEYINSFYTLYGAKNK